MAQCQAIVPTFDKLFPTGADLGFSQFSVLQYVFSIIFQYYHAKQKKIHKAEKKQKTWILLLSQSSLKL